MIRLFLTVTRAEGLRSALRRTMSRAHELIRRETLLLRGRTVHAAYDFPVLNVLPSAAASRLGGVQTQLLARLRIERMLRPVAFLYTAPRKSVLELSVPVPHALRNPHFQATARISDDSFENAVRCAMDVSGARVLHVEGVAGIPVGSLLRLATEGLNVILSVHDFSLFCSRPNLMEVPAGRFCNYSTDPDRCQRCLEHAGSEFRDEHERRRAVARQLLERVHGLIFPSPFLLHEHRRIFSLPQLRGHVVEPGIPAVTRSVDRQRRRIAFAGSVSTHKGAHLLPAIIRALEGRGVEWHVFGGGDPELLRDLRRSANTVIHGYYETGLPQLLERYEIGLVVMPSIVPESFGLTLSEAWAAGVPVVAFAHGAIAERILRQGGGWLVPPAEAAAGLIRVLNQWVAGELQTVVPASVPTDRDGAAAHVSVYGTR